MQPAESIPPPPQKRATEPVADARPFSHDDVQRLLDAIVTERSRPSIGASTPVTLTIGQLVGVIAAIVVALFTAKFYADGTFATKEALSVVAKDVRDLTADVKGLDKRTVAVEARLEAIDKRLDGMDKRIDQLTTAVTQLSDRVASLDKTVSSFIAVQQSRRVP
jgi:uncharacterized protein YoxC